RDVGQPVVDQRQQCVVVHEQQPPAGPAVADSLASTARDLRTRLAEVANDPTAGTVVAGARGLALRTAFALTAALLVEQAAERDELAETAARLWTRRRLRGEDIAIDAANYADVLC
ncbi:hypothetical protein, partial [Asanoa sp. NPDC050611]|uniref:hypothetical protein n=1 Tax=Asanoa sp. NPDC050611 TaxID=3157098 RepID=UPI0033D650E2